MTLSNMRILPGKCRPSQAPDTFHSTQHSGIHTQHPQQGKAAVVSGQDQEANTLSHRGREVEPRVCRGSKPLAHTPLFILFHLQT